MNAVCVVALGAMVCLGGPATGGAGGAARGQQPAPAAAAPIPVEVWRGGCCLPTLSLRDALEDAFGQAPAFLHPAPQSGPENLIVYIPDAVRLETSGGRARAVYRVEFRAGSTTGRLLRSSTGSCRDDAMSACAARIVEDAKQAARKLRRSATAAR